MRFIYFVYDKERFFLFYEEKPAKILSEHIKNCGELSSMRIKGINEQLLRVLEELQLKEILHNKILSSSIFIV